MVLYPKIKDFRTQDIDAKQQRIIEMRWQKNFASVFRSYYAIRQENSDILKPLAMKELLIPLALF